MLLTMSLITLIIKYKAHKFSYSKFCSLYKDLKPCNILFNLYSVLYNINYF